MKKTAPSGALQICSSYALAALAAAALTLAAGAFLAGPGRDRPEAQRAPVPGSDIHRLSMRILRPSGVLRADQPFTVVQEEERRPAAAAQTAALEEHPPVGQVAASFAPETAAASGETRFQSPAGLQAAAQPSAPPAVHAAATRSLPPAPRGEIRPVYPAQARRRGLEGHARVRVLIGADGTPLQAEVQTSSGHSLLDQAALSAVLAAAFSPAEADGRPAPGELVVPVRFVLVER